MEQSIPTQIELSPEEKLYQDTHDKFLAEFNDLELCAEELERSIIQSKDLEEIERLSDIRFEVMCIQEHLKDLMAECLVEKYELGYQRLKRLIGAE